MDVVWGETAGVDGQLWLLCPILFILQVTTLHGYLQYMLATQVFGIITLLVPIVWAMCDFGSSSSF
jgi:hypothetical protein